MSVPDSKHGLLTRRLLLQRMAIIAGLSPIVHTIPSSGNLHSPSILPTPPVTQPTISTSHTVFILDPAPTARTRYIAEHLAELGFAAMVVGVSEVMDVISVQFGRQSELSEPTVSLIGLGNGAYQAMNFAHTGHFRTLILDAADQPDQDLLPSFEKLQRTPAGKAIRTLIVRDITASATLLSVTRFLTRYTLPRF